MWTFVFFNYVPYFTILCTVSFSGIGMRCLMMIQIRETFVWGGWVASSSTATGAACVPIEYAYASCSMQEWGIQYSELKLTGSSEVQCCHSFGKYVEGWEGGKGKIAEHPWDGGQGIFLCHSLILWRQKVLVPTCLGLPRPGAPKSEVTRKWAWDLSQDGITYKRKKGGCQKHPLIRFQVAPHQSV